MKMVLYMSLVTKVTYLYFKVHKHGMYFQALVD